MMFGRCAMCYVRKAIGTDEDGVDKCIRCIRGENSNALLYVIAVVGIPSIVAPLWSHILEKAWP